VNLTFVVSSGRAGSTLISQILHEHPDVLSISEFHAALMGVLRRHPYPDQDMDGEELWRMLATPDPIADALVEHGLDSPEMFYPYGRGRFTPRTGIPIICHSTLSMLSDDPDTLFDKLAAEVPSWPVRSASDQYRALFAYLAAMFGRSVVVERSGGSLVEVALLHRQFPEARMVHLYRDGPDCALSMSRFPMFQIGIVTYQAAIAAGLPSAASWRRIQDKLPDSFAGLLSPPYDLSRLSEFEFDPVFFGTMWSDMMRVGVPALEEMPDELWDTLRYEDLLRDPAAELARLASFIGVKATSQWLATADRLIDRGKAGKSAQLDQQTLARLRDACAAGEAILDDQSQRKTARQPMGTPADREQLTPR
jgi:hypothetical protein